MREAQHYGVIYCITNQITGKSYVGQTRQRPAVRWRQHVSGAKSGRSKCTLLVHSLQKYGEQAFGVTVLDIAQDQQDLNTKEMAWIVTLNTLNPNGYNLKKGGDGGGAVCLETRERQRQAQLGKKQSKETIEKRRAVMTGRKCPGTSEKLRISWETRNRVPSEETRQKMRDSHKNRVYPAERLESMRRGQRARREREALLGTGPQFSPETREAMRQAKLGRKASDETRAKMSLAQRMRNEKRSQIALNVSEQIDTLAVVSTLEVASDASISNSGLDKIT